MGDAADDAERRADLEVEEGEVMEDGNLPVATRPTGTALVARDELTVEDIVKQMETIEQAMKLVMKLDVHYGVIPGTNKPTLLQPGAQKLNVLFRLAPSFRTERTWHDDGHLTVVSTCVLTHIPTGLVVASGDGLCSTREKRYAQRRAQRVCPSCGQPQIKRSKFPPKETDYEGASPSDEPGWYCWKKEGGCGRNFAANDPAITGQEEGTVDNPDVADLYNTVLKMSNKRALIAATINGTAASDVFTQDVEDGPSGMSGSPAGDPPPPATTAPDAAPPPATATETPRWVPPETPTELVGRLGYVMASPRSAQAWMVEALEQRCGVSSLADLETPARLEFLTLTARVLRDLEEDDEGLDFRSSGVRELIAGLFKKHLDVSLVGPQWRLDPSEETLQTEADANADPNDIPF